MEFRQALRNMGLMGDKSYAAPEVDALFTELDKDNGGTLDLNELNEGFKAMKMNHKAVEEQQSEIATKAADLRAQSEKTKAAAEAVLAWEQEAARLATLTETPPVEARIGGLLIKKNLKPGDIFTQWDIDGSGFIDRKEFEIKLQELGLEATSEELDQVFNFLNKDGNHGLDYEEVRVGLKGMYDAKQSQVEEMRNMTKQLTTLQREAQSAQLEVLLSIEREEVLRKQQEEKAAAEAEAREAEEAAAAEAARQAEEAKAKAKAKAKEEFDKKIQEKRLNRNDALSVLENPGSNAPKKPPAES